MALIKSNAHYLGTIFGQDAKVVPKKDGSGKIDVYFGGLNAAGDGIGHGHATIERMAMLPTLEMLGLLTSMTT